MNKEQDEEKRRIQALNRNDLVLEYVHLLDINEMKEILFEHIYGEDSECSNEALKEKLIEWTVE